jgi:nickel/cobalt transporter (NicO) family protein
MTTELNVLLVTAASIGFVHTLFGPDHYLPFLVIGKARNWSMSKTIMWTVICGIGHVLSSVLLGLVGVALKVQLEKLVHIESFRGNLAAWALIAFGLIYAIWGLRYWYKKRGHSHFHESELADGRKLTPWILFVIFVLGPCEPLIPILMYPAANASIASMLLVTGVFAVVTIGTMLVMVVVPSYFLSFVKIKKLSTFSHALAGFVIFLSGMAIQFLGL